ncbi:MAG: acyl--CoA ligase [Gammaproteobacteria bacterium]|nr:acyl--CoA ligase [Gammaproteobacteria bacterium]
MENLAIHILRHAAETPDKVATRSGTVSLTYAQLEEQARKAAYALSTRGVAEGSVVGIALRDGQQTITAMLGVWLLGGSCNLIDFRAPATQKTALSQTYNHILILDDRTPPEGGYASLSLAQWAEALAAAPASPVPPLAPQSPSFISVTSGTTGRPASVEISHKISLNRAALWAGSCIRDAYKRYLNTTSMSYGPSQGWVINSLLSGGTVIFFPNMFQPRDLVEAFAKHRITGCVLAPTVLRDLMAYVRKTGMTPAPPDTPLWLVATGGPIQPSELLSIRDLLSPNVIHQYACLAVGPLTYLVVGKELDKVDTVGRPHPGVDVEIVDENDTPLPPMSIGLIRIRTPGRAISIKGRAKNAASDFFKGEWYYPGDLGLLDEDGYLKLMGRSTDVIIRGGVNVYPQEVEAVVSDLPGVRQVAAVGYPNERAGEEIALFVVVDPGVGVEELHRHYKARMTPDKRPKRILIIPEMPLNANGKVVRQALSKMIS